MSRRLVYWRKRARQVGEATRLSFPDRNVKGQGRMRKTTPIRDKKSGQIVAYEFWGGSQSQEIGTRPMAQGKIDRVLVNLKPKPGVRR